MKNDKNVTEEVIYIRTQTLPPGNGFDTVNETPSISTSAAMKMINFISVFYVVCKPERKVVVDSK